jgi:hypothetical protein
MQKLLFILLFLPLFSLYSCEKQTNNCPDLIQSVQIEDFPMDLYGVNEVEVLDDELRINVNYGGGCEDHEFELFNIIDPFNGGGQQMDVLYLSHNANNDVCYAEIIEHQLCFDISEIINGGWLYFSHPDSLYDLN